MLHNRRAFLKRAALSAAVASIIPEMAFAATYKRSLGLQLYSLRETISENVRGTLEKVAEIGFKEVETYGYAIENGFWGTSVKQFNQILNDNGMTTPSGHYGVDPFLAPHATKDKLMPMLEVALELNQTYFVIPYLDDGLRTSIDDYKRLATKFNEAGELCKAHGLKLGYHNHGFEFIDYAGQNGYDILLSETDKNLVDFELDIYWVVRAGADTISLFNKYPGRFPLWHVKDMDKADHDLNTEIGAGAIDYTDISNNFSMNDVKHLIIEQENFAMDAIKSLTESFNYVDKDLLSRS